MRPAGAIGRLHTTAGAGSIGRRDWYGQDVIGAVSFAAARPSIGGHQFEPAERQCRSARWLQTCRFEVEDCAHPAGV